MAEKITTSKKESGVSRIVGVETEEERAVLDFFKRQFGREGRASFEKEHPKELDELMLTLNVYLRKFLKRYGIDSIDVPAKNVHIIDHSKLTP